RSWKKIGGTPPKHRAIQNHHEEQRSQHSNQLHSVATQGEPLLAQAGRHNRRKTRAGIFRRRGFRASAGLLRTRRISLTGPLIRTAARAFTQELAEKLLVQP